MIGRFIEFKKESQASNRQRFGQSAWRSFFVQYRVAYSLQGNCVITSISVVGNRNLCDLLEVVLKYIFHFSSAQSNNGGQAKSRWGNQIRQVKIEACRNAGEKHASNERKWVTVWVFRIKTCVLFTEEHRTFQYLLLFDFKGVCRAMMRVIDSKPAHQIIKNFKFHWIDIIRFREFLSATPVRLLQHT